MKKAGKARILIVDDHPVLRAGLRTIIDSEPTLEIVGEAVNAAEALSAMRTWRPEVLLLTSACRIGAGLKFVGRQAVHAASTRFVSDFLCGPIVSSSMRWKPARTVILLKEKDARDIARAIHVVLAGGTVFEPVSSRSEVEPVRDATGAEKSIQTLAPQELRVLSELGGGKTDKEIAVAMDLKAKTVRHYLDSIFDKLGVNTRTQAALVWMRHRGVVHRIVLSKDF